MLKPASIKTESFTYKDNFMIDIVRDINEVSAWLYHKDFGIKKHLFGVPLEEAKTIEDFQEMILVQLPEYIEEYKDEYMNE